MYNKCNNVANNLFILFPLEHGMIVTNDLSFSYNQETGFSYPNFTCNKGEGLLIIGKSGCGKTTLLHILAGILSPKMGSVTINETSIYSLAPSALDKFRGNNIGIVFQKPYFIDALSMLENIKIASKNTASTNHILEVCNTLSIKHLLHKKPTTLSSGELQRAAIARALINKPSLIVADEPTSSLDDENAFAVIQLLKEQAKTNNCCLIVVTHDQRIKVEFEKHVELR
jgi:ABC-type lipoprotein export system ATPase subunit